MHELNRDELTPGRFGGGLRTHSFDADEDPHIIGHRLVLEHRNQRAQLQLQRTPT